MHKTPEQIIEDCRKALEEIAKPLLSGRAAGKVDLMVRRGGLPDRNATNEHKALFKEKVLPFFSMYGRPKSMVTGYITLNFCNGKLDHIGLLGSHLEKLKNDLGRLGDGIVTAELIRKTLLHNLTAEPEARYVL
jgi:hypothetical protein